MATGFDITRHPLLRPDRVDEVFEYFPALASQEPFAKYMPMTSVDTEIIQMDMEQAERGGMSPAVPIGGVFPTYESFTRGYIEWEPMQVGEKVILTEQDLRWFRRIGSKSDEVRAMEILARKYSAIEARLARRIDYMRKQVLFDGQVVIETKDGLSFTVDYQHPAYLEPTVSTSWAAAGATPLQDIQLWVESYVKSTGLRISEILLPIGLLRKLTVNTEFRNTAVNSHGAFDGSAASARAILGDYIGMGGAIREELGMYDLSATLTAAVAASNTSLVLNDTTFIQVGDKIVLKSRTNLYSEQVTVSAVSHATKTLTVSAIVNPDGYAAGDPVKHHMYAVPENKILMLSGSGPVLPSTNENREGGVTQPYGARPFADICSTVTYINDLVTPRNGIFRKNIDKRDQEIPSLEQLIGIRCLPRVHTQEGWMVATVIL